MRKFFGSLLRRILYIKSYFQKKYTWTIKNQWSSDCVWTEPDGSINDAGKCLVVGEENGFNSRRLRVVIKPSRFFGYKNTKSYYAAIAWVNEPRPAIPNKFRIHSVK